MSEAKHRVALTPRPASPSPTDPVQPTKAGTVLVVDDISENIEVVAQCLKEEGYSVLVARNGETGIVRARYARPDLILLDVLMPGMDGLETCRRLKADPATAAIPVIFMTVAGELEQRIAGFAAGGVDYISKPVHLNEVVARVSTHLTIAQTQTALRRSEERYRNLLEHSLQGVVVYQDERIVYANPATARMVGYETDLLQQLDVTMIDQIIHPDDLPLIQYLRTIRDDGEQDIAAYELRCFHRDGHLVWIECASSTIDFNGKPAIQMTFVDITERKASEARLRNLNAHLQQTITNMEVLNQMSQALQRSRHEDEAIETAFPFLQHLFGAQTGALSLLTTDGELQQVAAWGTVSPTSHQFKMDDCIALVEQQLTVSTPPQSTQCAWVNNNGNLPGCCVPVTAEGEPVGVLHLCQLSDQTRNEHEHQLSLAAMAADVIGLAVANIRLHVDLQEQALRDTLTGLYNRRFLYETLERKIIAAQRYQQTLAVLLLDIDHFKQINDLHGHDAGDTVLREVAHLLQRNVRMNDTVCRFGGEEIIILLDDVPAANATARANELRVALHALTVTIDDIILPALSVSVGVALYPTHGTTADTLITAADQALYEAKANGRNCVVLATP